ncbi:hypothetical protein EC973_003257 [Apophysomyces ossiformis]|uniref:T-complex protein 11-like protein 1 n=1 Tax=Apophysomyces ossiformis TaxID=679940 RepID=A0A8H7EUM3_9FUNG|nr:hypothetical protein EC973_003257 [Apophysomyces ossiformis]
MEQTVSGFYIVDSMSLRQASKKPCHLEQRFLRMNPSISSLEAAELKREALLEARRQKLSRKFLEIQKVVEEVKARKEKRRLMILRSLEVAEVKRKNQIEQRRAASKELVERAKVIAQQNHRRYEAEQERLRLALESRLEETRARRLNMLGLPKSRILVTDVKTSPDCDSKKCVKLQSPSSERLCSANEKRKMTFSTLRRAFDKLSLPKSSLPDTWLPFNELVKLLRQDEVIKVTARVLHVALKMPVKDSLKKARVLLTAYMMLMCPSEIFQDTQINEQQELISAAKQLLLVLEKWLDSHSSHVRSSARLALEECWNSFYALFESWKAKDMEYFLANITAYYLELVRLKETLKNQEGAESATVQLNEQLSQVKARMYQLGGNTALEKLAEAEKALVTELSKTEVPSVPPSPTPRPEKLPASQTEQPQVSPEQLTRLLSGYAPASGISNEQLAHEIILDPDFKIQKHQPQTKLEAQVRRIATQAFFDQVRDDIKNEHPERSLPNLMRDIRDRILPLVRPESTLHQSINDAMDITLIEQQTQHHSFDLDGMLRYVLNIMRQICAPVRDQAIQEIEQLEDSIQKIRSILEILEEMSLDLVNFRLRALRPHLIPIAVEYERAKFAEALRQGSVGLAKTRSWLQSATHRLHEVAIQRNPEGVLASKNKPTPEVILDDAFVSILTSAELCTRTTCPETILLDVDRLAAFQNEAQATTMVAALVMLAKNFGTSDNLDALADKLFVMLQDHSTDIDHLATEIERNISASAERRPMIRNMVDKTLSHSDTVYSLLARRVGSVIRCQLQTGQFASREILTSYGLDHVRKTLKDLCDRLLVLVRYHRQVYAPWYDEIIQDELRQL